MLEINQISPSTNSLYGVLKYSSQNIGNEIQSIAATRFLPQIDFKYNKKFSAI